MTGKTHHEQVADLVADLDRYWPLLLEVKTPGTRRRWQESTATRTVTSDRLERLAPSAAPSPAPVVVSVLDLVARVAQTAGDVGWTVAEVAGVSKPSGSPYTNPIRWLEHAHGCLRAADERDASTSAWVIGQLSPLVVAVAYELGEARTGQTLRALCPWCGGRTDAVPTGGERTLQVILPDVVEPPAPGEQPADVVAQMVDEAEPLIVCFGLDCVPPTSKCGRRHLGRPAWPEREWDWLAKNLLDLDSTAAAS